jgi:hypothetical protein
MKANVGRVDRLGRVMFEPLLLSLLTTENALGHTQRSPKKPG